MNNLKKASVEPGQSAQVTELQNELADLRQELQKTKQRVLALYTEFSNAHAELAEDRRLVEESGKLKGELLANVSHEIRTPMNAIIGLTEVILSRPLNPGQLEPLETIREAGISLLALINDVLDFSKIEARMFELNLVDFKPSTLLETTAELLRGLAQEKDLTLRLWIDPQLPSVLRGDRNRLRQILLNLIGNAIKFSEHGEIVVSVTASQPGEMTVTVQDKGIGLSPEAQARLFRPFVQGEGSITRQQAGTGLGLSICKRLVELMGGKIWVESILGQGSTFGFRVPQAVGSTPTLVDQSQARAQRALPQGARILVAEDHLANQLVARHQLELLGLKADFVRNGRAAVEAINTNHYDLVLMDCLMPEISGYQATREIRRTEEVTGKHVQIVAMTAGALSGDRAKCLEAGMDDYISKPVEAATLRRVLCDRLANLSGDDEPTRDVLEPINFQSLEINYGVANVPELAGLFVEGAGLELQELLLLVGERDLEGTGKHLHGLRGLCGIICSPLLVSDCEQLHQAKTREDWGEIERLTRILTAHFEQARQFLRVRYSLGAEP